jgi:hypothetical protein
MSSSRRRFEGGTPFAEPGSSFSSSPGSLGSGRAAWMGDRSHARAVAIAARQDEWRVRSRSTMFWPFGPESKKGRHPPGPIFSLGRARRPKLSPPQLGARHLHRFLTHPRRRRRCARVRRTAKRTHPREPSCFLGRSQCSPCNRVSSVVPALESREHAAPENRASRHSPRVLPDVPPRSASRGSDATPFSEVRKQPAHDRDRADPHLI